MKKIFLILVVMAVAAVSASSQVLGLNLGDDSALVKQKLTRQGFKVEYDMGNEINYISDKAVLTEDGFLVTRAHLGFKNNKLVCVNVDYPYVLSPVMCAIAYHDYLIGEGDWDLKRLEAMSGEARKWRMFENTLILGNNQRWRNYSLLTIANSSRGLIHAEIYFSNGKDVIGVEWYDDDVTFCWGTREFYGLE